MELLPDLMYMANARMECKRTWTANKRAAHRCSNKYVEWLQFVSHSKMLFRPANRMARGSIANPMTPVRHTTLASFTTVKLPYQVCGN